MSKKVELYLYRHGNTFNTGDKILYVGKQTDLDLTSHGLEQAQNLANYFKNRPFDLDAIYSGPLQRHTQSLKILEQELKLSGQIEPRLNEIDYGAWEGQETTNIILNYEEEYEAWNQKGQWAEKIFKGNMSLILSNIQNLVLEIFNQHEDQAKVLCISSNGLIKLFLSLIPGTWDEVTSASKLENYKVKTGNLCKMTLTEQGASIDRWNFSI